MVSNREDKNAMKSLAMLVHVATIFAVAMFLSGCSDSTRDSMGLPENGDRLYVVQGNDESLGEINLTTGAVTQHVLSLGLWCNDTARFPGSLF